MRPVLLTALALGLCAPTLVHAQPEAAPAEEAPAAETPAEAPAEDAPAEAAPAEAAPAEAPAEAAPADEPAGAAPSEEPAEAAPAEEKPAEEPAAEKAAEPNLRETTKPAANVQEKPAEPALPAWEPATTGQEPGQDMVANWDVASAPVNEVSYPWVEHHGYFRTRLDLFHNLDLETGEYAGGQYLGSSPYRPPLTESNDDGSGHPEDSQHQYGGPCYEARDNEGNTVTRCPDRNGDTLAGANMRFRYQPTFHIAETLRVRGTIDFLDNLVLGSTPEAGLRGGLQRPDVAFETFAGTQRPPESGVTTFYDSVRVKQLWGEWKTPVGLLMFGRMASQWGLGILANNGNCLDCDFGDNVDRIMGVTKLFDTYIALAWDFVAEGPIGHPGAHTLLNQPFGQPYDVEQRDDVNEWVIALFQRPLTREEKEKRDRDLNELRKPVFDWGVYNVIRNQAFLALNPERLDEEGTGDLVDVKALAWIPDVWLNFQYHPRRDHEMQFQLEAAGIFGVIEELPQYSSKDKFVCEDPEITPDRAAEECPADQLFRPRKRDIEQWGYAFEYDHRMDSLKWGLRQGAASGDDTPGFGVIDKTPLDPEDPNDQEVTNFKFDRDYIVDLILFRQLIGSVTNAAYFKPYIAYDIIRDDKEAWGFEFAPMFAFALEELSTPGLEKPLGLEFDLELYVEEFDRFRWSLQYGLLFPFGAFDFLDTNPNTGQLEVKRTPGAAQTLQMNVGMMF
jgi:uncharacterized protein (TIGR04551 family)